MNQLTLADLREYWEFHNRTEGKSGKTIKWYNDVLNLFERFLESEQLPTFIADIGEPEVRAFIHYLQNKTKRVRRNGTSTQEKLSSEGVQNRLRALKAFFSWLHAEGYTEEHRLQRMRNIRIQKKVVDILIDEEITRILACCDVKTPRGARMHAVVTLMLDTGLRFREVIALKESDVDIESGTEGLRQGRPGASGARRRRRSERPPALPADVLGLPHLEHLHSRQPQINADTIVLHLAPFCSWFLFVQLQKRRVLSAKSIPSDSSAIERSYDFLAGLVGRVRKDPPAREWSDGSSQSRLPGCTVKQA